MRAVSLQVLFFRTLSFKSRFDTRHLLNVLAAGCIDKDVCDPHYDLSINFLQPYMSSIDKSRLSISYLNKTFFRSSSTLCANKSGLKFLDCLFTSATKAFFSSA